MNQQKIWEVLAEGWYNWRYWPIKSVDVLAKKWEQGKILDIGCGNCRNLIPFLKKGFVGVGLDFSKEMLKGAEKRLKKEGLKAKLKLGKAEKLPFKNSSFDYCLFIASLHHLQENDRTKALKEMKRVLKKSGKGLITVWKDKNKKETFVNWERHGKIYKRYYYFFNKKELNDLIEEVGFKILNIAHDKKNLIFVVEKI